MPPAIASVVYAVGIAGLFWLDRDRESRTSKGLWIPTVWLLIAASRPVSAWLQMSPPINQPDAYLEGSPIDRIALTALLTLGLIVLWKRGQQVASLLGANGPVLLLLTYCAMSSLWSDYPDVSIKRWIKFVGNFVMVLIVLTDLHPTVAVKRLLARTGFILLPISVLLIKYYGDLGRLYSPGESVFSSWRLMYTGVTYTKNGLGAICLLLGLGALWRSVELLREKDEPRRLRPLIAQIALLLITLWLFSIANSMTSLSCFLVAGSLILATRLRRLGRSRAMVHILVVGALSLSMLAIFVAPNLLATVGRDPTLTGRTDIWKLVLSMAGSPLFGTGFESFWLGPRLQSIWTVYWWHPNEAHNGYVEIFLNLGWLGVSLFTAILVTGYRNIIAALRGDPDFGRIRLAYFVAGIMYNFTESGFRMIDPVWFLFLLAVIVVPRDTAEHLSDHDLAYNEHFFDIEYPEEVV